MGVGEEVIGQLLDDILQRQAAHLDLGVIAGQRGIGDFGRGEVDGGLARPGANAFDLATVTLTIEGGTELAGSARFAPKKGSAQLKDTLSYRLKDATVSGALEIKAKLGIKRVRGDTFGYLQRSFIGCVSDVDQREAREVGEKAVQFAMWGKHDGSVAIKRTGFYSVDYELQPLENVAAKTRTMEDEFIAPSGTDVTDAFRLYLRPLLGSGLPDAYRLRPAPVAKVLGR